MIIHHRAQFISITSWFRRNKLWVPYLILQSFPCVVNSIVATFLVLCQAPLVNKVLLLILWSWLCHNSSYLFAWFISRQISLHICIVGLYLSSMFFCWEVLYLYKLRFPPQVTLCADSRQGLLAIKDLGAKNSVFLPKWPCVPIADKVYLL